MINYYIQKMVISKVSVNFISNKIRKIVYMHQIIYFVKTSPLIIIYAISKVYYNYDCFIKVILISLEFFKRRSYFK